MSGKTLELDSVSQTVLVLNRTRKSGLRKTSIGRIAESSAKTFLSQARFTNFTQKLDQKLGFGNT